MSQTEKPAQDVSDQAIAAAFREAKQLSAERAPQYQVAYNWIEDRARELQQAQVVGEDHCRRALQTIHEFAEEGGTHWEFSAARVARKALGLQACGDCGVADCLDCREPHE